MVDPVLYVPVLPVKAGELRALKALDAAVGARLSPLFVVTTTDGTHTGTARPPPEQVLDHAVDRIAGHWGSARAFVDVLAFRDEPVSPGVHPVGRLLARAHDLGMALVPVTGPADSEPYREAVREVAVLDGRGVCLRVPASAFPMLRDPGFSRTVLGRLRVTPEDVDLVLDLGDHARSARAFPAVAATVAMLPWPYRWRSLVVAGTAYPPSGLGDGLTEVRRVEWIGYRSLWESGAVARMPAFGDYGITHPTRFETSPYAQEVTATLRYTTSDSWLVVRGDLYSSRDRDGIGAAAIPPIARQLRDHLAFGLSHHCRMESWIAEVVYVGSGARNPTTWHQHATHHHLLVVAEQLDQLRSGRAGGLPEVTSRPPPQGDR